MRRAWIVGVVAMALGVTALPEGRTAAVDLASATVPWVRSDPAETATGGTGGSRAETAEIAGAAEPVDRAEEADGDESSPAADSGLETGPDELTSIRPRLPGGDEDPGDDAHHHEDGPPPDLEISDDLPIPPLAPGVGTLDEPVARPLSDQGPHWVPFKGNRILWCVYRGAGRCGGHHPYPAIDVDMPPGTPVYASGPGVVYQSCNRGSACGGYGNHVRIRHNNNIRSIYGHFTRAVVRAGQRVGTGTLLGYSGCTGRCNGAHLHYEERNAAEQSIQIGQMQGYTGRRVVTYPNVWGYRSWTGIPPDRFRIRNDFFPQDDRDDDLTPDSRDRCIRVPGPTWTAGCPMPRGAPDSGDRAVIDGRRDIRHSAISAEGHLVQYSRYERGWQATDRGQPGAVPVGPYVTTIVAADGTPWTFTNSADGRVWSGRDLQGRWQWAEIGNLAGGLGGGISAAARADGSIVVHAVDESGSLWRAVLDQVQGWVWSEIGPRGVGFRGSVPASFTDGQGVVTTAVVDRNGTLHRLGFYPRGGTSARTEAKRGVRMTGQRPAVIADAAGLTSVFTLSRDGHLWRLLRSYKDTWVWLDHGAVPGGNGGKGVSARHISRGRIVVAVMDRSGRLRTSVQRSTLLFAWGNLGAAGPVQGLGEPSALALPNGAGHFVILSGGELRTTAGVSRWSWVTRRTGPPVAG